MSRLQFSIRLIFLVTAAVAVIAWAATAPSSRSTFLGLTAMSLAFCSVSIALCAATTRKVRSFWVGVSTVTAFGVLWASTSYFQLRVSPGVPFQSSFLRDGLFQIWCFAPISGLVCAIVHWVVWPRTRRATGDLENENSK